MESHPSKIIVLDEENGAIVATLQGYAPSPNGEPIPVYKQQQYYHRLEDAVASNTNPRV